MPYLKKFLIFFHASFFGISRGSWSISTTPKNSKFLAVNNKKVMISELFVPKFMIFWTFMPTTFLYAVCWGCNMAHFKAETLSFSVVPHLAPAHSVQANFWASKVIFLTFLVNSGGENAILSTKTQVLYQIQLFPHLPRIHLICQKKIMKKYSELPEIWHHF